MADFPDGIEWFEKTGALAQCARCGSSVDSVTCGNPFCHEGLEYDDDDQNASRPRHGSAAPCSWCRGKYLTWHCVSSPDWCQANPLPGREHVQSTAMTAAAWGDQ